MLHRITVALITTFFIYSVFLFAERTGVIRTYGAANVAIGPLMFVNPFGRSLFWVIVGIANLVALKF